MPSFLNIVVIEVMALDTRELFARMLKCEAGGEGLDGMRAVATVIMNRVHVANGEYQRVNQGSLRRVMEQPYQFTCMLTQVYGEPNPQNVWAATPDDIHYEVADWALGNGVFSGVGSSSLWYMNPFNPNCPGYFPYNQTGYWLTRINDHCFYNPTAAYAQT
jgi:N-acetylmuramoyl-L-alanine amidase